MLSRGLSLDASRLVDGSPVQEELLRKRSLAGIRVGDDGKGPSLFYLLFYLIIYL